MCDRNRLFLPLLMLCAACEPGLGRTPAGNEAPVAIGRIQGSGDASALQGQTVVVEGVVTARLDGLKLIVLQDAGDGDPATSDALFLADVTADVAVGQALRVEGVVEELTSGNRSQVTGLRVHALTSLPPRPMPPAQILTAPLAHDQWERHEAMRLEIRAPLTLTGVHNAYRYGEWQASFAGRLWAPTEVALPGARAQAMLRDNRARSLLLDDGKPGDKAHTRMSREIPRAGSELTDVVGILDERFGQYRLQLTSHPQIREAVRPSVPAKHAALRVAAFNLENLFNGDGRGDGFPTGRGASSMAAYQAQQGRLVAALSALDADVLALMEMENDGQDALSAEAQLLAALNAAGNGDWQAVRQPASRSSDVIRNAIFYRASRLRPVGEVLLLDEGAFSHRNRPSLAVRLQPLEGGAPLVVIANHFKSKNCTQARGIEGDQRDGQGCWNATRLASVRQLDAWVSERFADEAVLMAGDFNAYAMEDPPRWLREHGWHDAFADAAVRPYSYVYQGAVGRLDHAFVNSRLADRLQAAHVWHINVDEPYRPEDAAPMPWGSSDHDPLLIDFSL